ncbi:MAG: HD-GYP domain-containing protein, partial [Beijerinckiaceae bacterium]
GWIDGVRLHHDVTYQHCLLVTGIAIAFGQQLGFPRRDLQRIALGALMILHPEFGVSLLRSQPGVTDELTEIVLRHHEFLDGSGYPDGLMADSIPDIVRLLTVADIFAALIEKRAYREPMRGEEAYEILLTMEGKLDMPIVRAIRATAFRAAS